MSLGLQGGKASWNPVGEDDLWGQRRCPQAQGWKGASSGRAQWPPQRTGPPQLNLDFTEAWKRLRKGISQIVRGTYLAWKRFAASLRDSD